MGALKYSVTKWNKRFWVSRSSRKISLELFESRQNFKYTREILSLEYLRLRKYSKEKVRAN